MLYSSKNYKLYLAFILTLFSKLYEWSKRRRIFQEIQFTLWFLRNKNNITIIFAWIHSLRKRFTPISLSWRWLKEYFMTGSVINSIYNFIGRDLFIYVHFRRDRSLLFLQISWFFEHSLSFQLLSWMSNIFVIIKTHITFNFKHLYS